MELVTITYLSTKYFPSEELFGLTSQMRRCAVSVPSNIAEGYGRRSDREYHRFLKISLGSLFEFQTQLEIAKNLNYFSDDQFLMLFDLSRELERMLSAFIKTINKSII